MNCCQSCRPPTQIHHSSTYRIHHTLGCKIRDGCFPALSDTLFNETTDRRGLENTPKRRPLILSRQYLVAFPISNDRERVCHFLPIQPRPLHKLVKGGEVAWAPHPRHACRADFKHRGEKHRPL